MRGPGHVRPVSGPELGPDPDAGSGPELRERYTMDHGHIDVPYPGRS